jgi:hypothetical protein
MDFRETYSSVILKVPSTEVWGMLARIPTDRLPEGWRDVGSWIGGEVRTMGRRVGGNVRTTTLIVERDLHFDDDTSRLTIINREDLRHMNARTREAVLAYPSGEQRKADEEARALGEKVNYVWEHRDSVSYFVDVP